MVLTQPGVTRSVNYYGAISWNPVDGNPVSVGVFRKSLRHEVELKRTFSSEFETILSIVYPLSLRCTDFALNGR